MAKVIVTGAVILTFAVGAFAAPPATPAKAKQIKISLATTYNTCASPNTTHKPAIALPGCTPPVQTTNNNATNKLTFGPNGQMQAQIKVVTGDIKLIIKGKDIQNNGSPFTGTLTGVATIRPTDNGCTGPSFTT